MSTLIERSRKLDASGVTENFWVLIDGTSIVATGTGSSPSASTVVDADGRWLTSGFIDLHCHGGGGHSFEDGAEAIVSGLLAHRRRGTTRSIISLVASPLGEACESLSAIASIVDLDPLVLGSHLEGPFIASSRSGAHEPAYLRSPSAHEIEQLILASRGTLRQVTLAPELVHALAAADQFVAAGVVVAVGHTEASFTQTQSAFDHGARLLTHVFNAMPGIHHREPGPVVAAFGDDRVVVELIMDGTHVHPEVARQVFTEAPGRVALITDAMAAAGSHDGEYTLGALDVSVAEGIAHLRGTSTLAGSTLTQDEALRRAITASRIEPRLVVEALTSTPARVLGLDHRLGTVAPGFAADVVLLSSDWQVEAVWADGRMLA